MRIFNIFTVLRKLYVLLEKIRSQNVAKIQQRLKSLSSKITTNIVTLIFQSTRTDQNSP